MVSDLFNSEKRRLARREQAEAARQLAHARGETSSVRLPDEGLSTPSIVRAVVEKIRELLPQHGSQAGSLTSGALDYLDVGSGNGELIDRIMREFEVKVRACDYRDDLMTIGDLKVDVVDLNTGTLPYPNESFDLVTCTEVIEHLEHYRSALREMSRVLRSGGFLIVSTPNVLNLRSRLRYLLFGFFNMFGPLKLDDDRHHSTHGHINPVGYFYLAQALNNAGFTAISPSVDKLQRGSWFSLILLCLPIRIYEAWALWKERKKYRTLDSRNEPFVRQMNSRDLLLGRTLLVGCRKM